jgi:hypothetical protein
MTATSHLHIAGINMELANLPEVFAECLVQWSVARGIVGTIRTCRFLVSGLFVAVMDNYALNLVSIPRRFRALKISFPDAFPEWSPLNGSSSSTVSLNSQLSSIQNATVPAKA